ncbi:acyltransferase [Paenibacillus woosongensis]|uniref:acyltransferase n=1 Tax=Paenibacillus woosongensis TaxID=307580 RepID=UPI0012D9E267|nr:acyltransferase family protein [Paenibacillus woosongensis]
MKIIAIFAVINIHVSGSFSIASFTTTNITNWWLDNVFNGASRWAVPIFFMVSGMLLLEPKKNDSLKVFFTKRFNKIFIPFIVWGVLYELIKPRYTGVDFTFKEMIKDFLGGSIYTHFWFMYAIIVIYIFAPILKSFVAKASKETLLYTLAVWFVFVSILPQLEHLLKFNFDYSTDISFICSYAGYFLLGHVLSQYEFTKLFKSVVYTGAIIGLIFAPISTYYLTKKNDGNYATFFSNNLSPDVILIAVSVFLLFKSINWDRVSGKKQEVFVRGIETLSKTSFGIYLLHFIVLNELVRSGIGVFKVDAPSILRVPITDIAVFSISFAVIYLLQKIPLVKKIVP